MGKAAATNTSMAETCNDPTNMPVGTVIAVGTVMINNLPAAKQGDQVVGVDTHIIMIPSPGGPVPTPLPHPFSGIINGGLSSSVNIMGMPAATVDSTATNTPPHIPQGGPFQKPPENKATIKMGSMNVFIGNGGGGGGGGSASGAAVQAKAAAVKVDKGHYLDVTFKDKGGKTVTGVAYTIRTPDNQEMNSVLTGPVKKGGLKEGNYEIALKAISKAKWSVDNAKVGDKVKLQVEALGVEDGEKAILQIFIKDSNRSDTLFKTIETKMDGGKIEEEWELTIDDDLTDDQETRMKKGYSAPAFYFSVTVAGLKSRSGLLIYRDFIEIELKDDEGNPLKNVKYRIYFPNGSVKEGYVDGDGYAKVENVPPGKAEVTYDIRDIKK